MIKHLLTSNKKLLIILLLVFIFSCPIIIKYSPNNLQIEKLNILLDKLSSCNNSLCESVHNQSIDTGLAKDLLSSKIIELNSLSEEVSSTPVSQKNQLLKTKLIETISYNNSLYEITLSLLKSSDFNSLNSKFSEYASCIELVENSYNTLNILGLNGSFSEENKVFFENSSNYITTVIKISREKDIKSAQNKYFSQGINDCINLLDTISEDLKPALDKIKEDGRSINVLSDDIKAKRSKLATIKNKSYSISIPTECSSLYKEFQDTLNAFELYINQLQYSIISENSSTEAVINKNYDDSFLKYSSYTEKLSDFKKDLDIFNKNCI